MARLELPALRANDSLGVLAALGLLELCRSGLKVDARLAWSGPDGAAVMNVPFAGIPEFADVLASYAIELGRTGRLTPAMDPGLITPPLGTKARQKLEDAGALDPMKLPADGAVRRF